MSKIQESFFEDVKEEDIEQEEVKVESKYSLMFAFRPSVGSRERRIFLAHVPFYNIYKKLISICENGMMIGNVSDYVFRFKIDKYECDFGVDDKKSDIDSYITQILDAIGEKKAKSWGHTLLDMEYYIEFHRDSSLTQQEFCQSMTALNRWVVYAMHNFRVLDSSQKIYSEIKLLRDGYTLVKNDTERVGIYGELVADLWKKIYEREYDVSKKESIYL